MMKLLNSYQFIFMGRN